MRSPSLRLWTALLLVVVVTPTYGDWTFRLRSENRDLTDCPVWVTLPPEIPDTAILALEEAETETPLPFQRVDGTDQAVFLLSHPLSAGQTRTYRLRSLDEQPSRSINARCLQTEGKLTVAIDGEPVLTYHTAVVAPPPQFDAAYRRSGHLHPVRTPSGRVVTDEFPVDHPHQHGIFSAWVKTTFEGRAVDFWNQLGQTGTVEHREVLHVESGPVFSSFTVRLAHVDLSAPGGKKDVLHENWTIRTYAIKSGRLFELESVQRCVADSPLVLEEYHYGGHAVRGSAEWLGQPEHDFLTSEGKTRQEGNHSRPNWVSMHGNVDGEMCGIAVCSHPDNFRGPQPVRLHPSKPYFVFTPPVLGRFEIAPGAELLSRYRFFTYDGPPQPERLQDVWENYAQAAVVEWAKGAAPAK